MPFSFDLTSLFAFMAVVSATMVLLLFYKFGDKRLPRARLSRIQHTRRAETSSIADVPSIVRQRSILLRKRFRHSPNTGVQKWLADLEQLLQASGLRWRVPNFIALQIVVAVVVAIGAYLFTQIPWYWLLLFALGSVYFVSLNILRRLRERQMRRFQDIFPEALDLVVRSVRAGLPVSEAIKVISTEVASPVNEAFREVANQLYIGMSLDEALGVLQKNVPLAEVKFFAISLTIQQETGGNLAEILHNLAAIMRKRAQLAKKIRAFSSEARASAYIIGSLPFLVGLAIFILNREYILVLFTDQTGQMFLVAAAVSISVGAIIIARLINFEV